MSLRHFIISNGNNIRTKDLESLDSIMNKFTSGGAGNLQIIADFDYTLTTYHRRDGKTDRGNTSWEFLDESELLPGYFQGVKEIINKYRPIEVNPKLSIEEKTAAMLCAYDEVNKLISKYDFTNELMDKLVEDSPIELRQGVKDFLLKAYDNQIPVLFITAGFGDVVIRLLKRYGVYSTAYTNVMGNFIKMGSGEGLKKPYLHVYNKKGKVFMDGAEDDVKREMRRRGNVLLLGDSMGDLGMSEGVFDEENGSLLRIGFLNHDINDPNLLGQYTSSYDIVLLDENTYELPKYVLNTILK